MSWHSDDDYSEEEEEFTGCYSGFASYHHDSSRDSNPLLQVVKDGYEHQLEELLHEGFRVTSPRSEEPLLLAALRFHRETSPPLLRRLLKAGANPNQVWKVNSRGYLTDYAAPLPLAVMYRLPEVVRLLLENGADPDISGGDLPQSLLVIAVEREMRDIVVLLLKHGASVDRTVSGRKPLATAAYHGRTDYMALLIAAGADVIWTSVEGESVLHCAAGFQTDARAVEFLLAAGASVANAGFHDGETPLVAACYRGAWKTVPVLVARGADVNLYRAPALSPLVAALGNNDVSRDTILFLVASGADLHDTNADGCGALTEAASYFGAPTAVHCLISLYDGWDSGDLRAVRESVQTRTEQRYPAKRVVGDLLAEAVVEASLRGL